MSRHFTSVVSSWFGKFASKEFPPAIQKFINGAYVKIMGLDMGEFKSPAEYKSLNKLFTRELMTPRELPEDGVISPSDSLVTQQAKIENKTALQIKGMEYSVAEFLGEFYSDEVEKLEAGEYINLYLSPKDYHRYHAPFDLRVDSIVHVPAKLYPVNIPFLKKKKNLFIENERVVISAKDSHNKRHFIVLVGALNVGKMVVTFEDKIKTNAHSEKITHYSYETPISLKRGELFGWFEMGSTIVMLSEKGAIKYSVAVDEKVKFAQKIGVLLKEEELK